MCIGFRLGFGGFGFEGFGFRFWVVIGLSSHELNERALVTLKGDR